MPPKLKKKSIAERKLELLTKCTEAISQKNDEPSKPKKDNDTKEPKVSTFALYITA